jgi:hypothetical protein
MNAPKLTTALATTTAALALSAAPSLAATPVVVGQSELGGEPDIAVDASGTAHLTWFDSAPAIDEARYCQLPRGGSACVNPETFVGAQPGDDDGVSGRPHVFVSGADTVTVFHQRGLIGGFMMANRSTDGGLSFGSRNRTGDAFPSSAAPREAVFGPGDMDTITSITEVTTGGTFVQNGSPLDDAPAAGHAQLSGQVSEDGAIGLDSDSRPVAVYETQAGLVWRKFTGQVGEPNINNAALWGPQTTISSESIAGEPSLAGGPNGLFLFWKQGLPDRGYVTKFTGSGWTPPVLITGGQSFASSDLTQDSSGRLHAVWEAYSDNELRYTWSDDGVNWAPAVDIARGESSYRYVRVSAAGDHQGFAVWDREGSDVAAVALEALPEPPAGSGGDSSAPTIGGLKASDSTLFPGQATKFKFNASEAGLAVLSVQKRVKGLKVKVKGKRRCVARSAKRVRKAAAKQRCRTWKKIGSIRKQVKAGANTIAFSGRLAGRKLKAGSYRALLKLTDSAGNVSRAETVRFRVIKRKKRK